MTGSSTSCSSPLCERRAFTAADVVALYLHRGAFEPQLADEDSEQDERLAGVVMRPPDSRRGRSSLSGSGTSVSNWVISSLRPHCGRRSLLRLSPSRLRRRATGRLWLGDLGRLGALREKPLPSSPMGRCAVQRGRRSFPLRLRGTGLAESNGDPVESCCAVNGWTYRPRLLPSCAPKNSLLSFPVRNVPTTVCPGKSG